MRRDPQPDWVPERLQALGDRVRNARIDADLTQERLAEQVGVSWRTIHRIERGLGDPKYSLLLRIAAAVRVPFHDLTAG